MKTVFLVSFPLLLIFISVIATAYRRSKRDNAENFNVLLKLYKLNPLKHSNVFQTFSNSILLPAQDGRSNALNFNSNESREKENSTNTKLKSREVINNAAHKTPDHHLYIEEVTPENFTPGQFLSKLVSMNGMDVDFKENIDTSINLGSKEKHDRATSFDDFPGNENTTKAFSEYRFSEYRVSNNTNHKPESRIKIMDNFFDMKGNSKADYDGVFKLGNSLKLNESLN